MQLSLRIFHILNVIYIGGNGTLAPVPSRNIPSTIVLTNRPTRYLCIIPFALHHTSLHPGAVFP